MVDQFHQYDDLRDANELPVRRDVVAEVERRLAAFHSPSFDREIVEELLAEIKRLKADLVETNRQFGQTLETCTAAVAEVERLREENSRLANRIAAKP